MSNDEIILCIYCFNTVFPINGLVMHWVLNILKRLNRELFIVPIIAVVMHED